MEQIRVWPVATMTEIYLNMFARARYESLPPRRPDLACSVRSDLTEHAKSGAAPEGGCSSARVAGELGRG